MNVIRYIKEWRDVKEYGWNSEVSDNEVKECDKERDKEAYDTDKRKC